MVTRLVSLFCPGQLPLEATLVAFCHQGWQYFVKDRVDARHACHALTCSHRRESQGGFTNCSTEFTHLGPHAAVLPRLHVRRCLTMQCTALLISHNTMRLSQP
eukprot:4032912-Amphidinium_carterae.1